MCNYIAEGNAHPEQDYDRGEVNSEFEIFHFKNSFPKIQSMCSIVLLVSGRGTQMSLTTNVI